MKTTKTVAKQKAAMKSDKQQEGDVTGQEETPTPPIAIDNSSRGNDKCRDDYGNTVSCHPLLRK